MRVFGLEIKKAEKEVKAMSVDEANIAVDGMAEDDTPVKVKKTKKHIGKKVLAGVGVLGAAACVALNVIAKNGDVTDPDVESDDTTDAAVEPDPVDADDTTNESE